MYLNLDEIYGLHLELTSRCNLYCPQCARTIHNNYPLDELDLTTLKSLFNGFSPSLIHICGNYGDSITYSDLHSAIDIFKNSGVKYTRVYTNGSARNSDWWTTLGEQLSLGNASGEIVFSIDGLEDTNHIYRKNSSWPIIMNSVKSFINAGGNAIWEMLAFEHNEHQIEDAKQLSIDLGFSTFRVKKANRFGKLGTDNDVVLPPKNTLFKHKSIIERDKEIKKVGYKKFKQSQQISCQYKERQWIYIDFNGTVFPCCWFGTTWWNDQFMRNFGTEESFNIKHHSLKDILQTPFYNSELERTWGCDDKSDICVKHCGNFDVSTKSNTIIL